ncbi:MAG: RDD family protein [Bacteroidota bacterium]
MNTIIIPTTQNIELEYPVANVGDRIVGGLVDVLILIAYWVFWLLILEEGFWDDVFATEEVNQTTQTLGILVLLPAVFYSAICEILMDGQTFGKKLTKTRTIRLDGASPTISQYLLRWVMRMVDILLLGFPGLVGLITMGVNKKGQRLGDLVAGTTVIKLKLVTSFMDTIYVETTDSYELVFPEITRLRDRDVSILKEVLDVALKSDNPKLLAKLSEKIKSVTGIQSDLVPRKFLETVLSDYNHYYGKL